MPTILVADDNSNIQKMVSLVFKEKGIRVVAVGNGEAACRKVPEVHPDVVLADVFMPVRNGYEVCEFVKQDPEFAQTPVILLVGAFDPLDEKEAQRVGADGVLKKPFVPPEPLVALVSSLLKTEPAAQEIPEPIEAAPAPSFAPVAPAPSAREVSRMPVPNDYDEADEIAPTFSEPVATPATVGGAEEADDESEPASEWARRRATMDYEIDAAESAHMVEKLAAGNAAEEAEILPSNKHVPFGGANVSEMPLEAVPQPSRTSRPDLRVPEVAAEPAAEAPQQEFAAERSSPSAEKSAAALPERDPEIELEADGIGEFSPPTPAMEEAASQETEPATAYGGLILESTETTNETQEAPSEAWSLPQTSQQADAGVVQSHDPELPKLNISPAEWPPLDAPAMRQDTAKQTVEPPLALPATSQTAFEEADSVASGLDPVEPPAKEPAAQEAIDPATVDDVVARVISKLEPQLHQALANGVLRPLVEEVLNQQRREKK